MSRNTRIISLQRLLAVVCFFTGVTSVNALLANDDNGQHPGPASWIEEYWDVKPDRFDDFVDAYRREVYSLSRHIPGYRGYTFLTNLPDDNGNPKPPETPDEMLTNHYGIHLQGKTLTKQAIDIGKLLMKTHNVVIVHHLQDWRYANTFRQAMNQAFAKLHGGADYADHLAETLYPLTNNYWETSFRLMDTGLQPRPGSLEGGKDADGYDLEPRLSDDVWMKEYFEVNAEDLDAFLDAYMGNTLVVMKPMPGYQGVTVVTSLPPEPDEAVRTHYAGETLGGPSEFYVPQPGVLMGGEIRTDTSINYSLLFKPTFTIITYYQVPHGIRMLELMQQNFERDHPGVDRLEHITRVLFPHAQNHWDMRYRAIETSFVPVPEN